MKQETIVSYLAKQSNFIDCNDLAQHMNSKTQKSLCVYTHEHVIIRSFNSVEPDLFLNCIDCIKDLKHPCIIPFIGYMISDDIECTKYYVITKYMGSNSLQDIIAKHNNGIAPDDWDLLQKIKILYGVSSALQYIHGKDIVHGKLSASNVVLDQDFQPYITDTMINKFSQNDIGHDTIYIAPELLRDSKDYSTKTDIYAFGILALQVLSGKINAYEGILEEHSQLIDYFQGGNLENIPAIIRDIIMKCLSINQENRPSLEYIMSKLDEAVNSLENQTDTSNYAKFQNQLLINNDNEEIIDLKLSADKGDVTSMFVYACACLKGQNLYEAVRYFRLAAKNGNEQAFEKQPRRKT